MFQRYESTKPLMYSVDMFLSLRVNEFVAVSAYPIVATQVNDQPKLKPYATGTTADSAGANLAKSITNMTGTKNLGIINIRHYHRYVCVNCHNTTSFEKKAELVEHRQIAHSTGSDIVYQHASDKNLVLP